jgi:hypothetical protein
LNPTEEQLQETLAAREAAAEARGAVALATRQAFAEPTPGPEFVPFPKIARLFREVIITEKIDGTNAAVGVTDDGQVYAQSRKRLITPEQDNHGFARWVAEHEDELRVGLGPGLHFGEWWGNGIQRGYGLENGDKRFSLFNVRRWTPDVTPNCCSVVPIIGESDSFSTDLVKTALTSLELAGSAAAPGYDDPEGVVVFHVKSQYLFKATIKNDDVGKEHGA